MHPFTRAGLGNAPFRCVRVTENWYITPGFNTKQPGGSCHYCGTGIAYEYHVESADGRTFKVGCDCIWKAFEGDKKQADAEVQGFRKARAELARTKREAGRKARTEARLAQWEAERVQRRAEFEAAEPAVCSILDKLLLDADPEAPTGFMLEMARAAQRFGSLTAGQLAAVKSNIAREEQRKSDKDSSRFVGEVGERISGEFEILATRSYESNFGWPRKLIHWSLMRYNGRDLVTYKGNFLGSRGDKFRAKFSVKEHETYNGAQQTKLARPKVEESAEVAA